MKYIKTILIFSSILLLSCSSPLTTEEYIQSGEALLNNKEWKSAIIEFKNAVQQSPDNQKARALLGEAYLNTYSSDAAIKEIKRAIGLGYDKNSVLVILGKAYEQKNENKNILNEININNAQSQLLQANIHALRANAFLRTQQPQKAKKELEKAKSLDENSFDVRLAWANFEKSNKNVEKQKFWLKPLLLKEASVPEAWSQMAEIEQLEENYDAAEKAYTRAINLRGVVHLDHIKRALLRILQKKYDMAMDDINILKNAGAQWPMVGYAEGLISYHQKDYDTSQSRFETVLAKYPDYMPAYLLMGLTHFNKANYQIAVTNLELYISRFPDAIQANFIYAASLLKIGNATDAIPVLEKINQSHPDNIRVLRLLANAYLTDKQQEKSIQTLTKAVDLKPSQANTRLQLGTALLRDNSGVEGAQQQLIKAIELDPELFQADLALFMSYMRTKDFSNARKVALALKNKQQDTSLGSNLVALSYLAEENKTQALSELLKTLKAFPADPATSSILARIYLKDKNLDKAKKLYLRVLDKHPSDLKTLNQMALISAKEKNGKAVIEWLKKGADRNPDVLSAKLLLATQYLRANEPSLAVKVLQNVKDSDKKQQNYILLMAKAKMGIGEYQHASRALNSLVTQEPGLSSAHFLLAQAYAYQNKQKKMREELESTVKYRSDHLTAHLMIARLNLLERKVEEFKTKVKFLVKNFPDNKEVQLLNAKVQSSENGYDSAIKTLTALMSETPQSEVVIDLSKNQWNTGKKDSAISNLELWLQDNADDRNALMLLAQFYLAESRNSEAKNLYQQLDKILPDNSVVLNNLAWLMIDSDVPRGIGYANKALQIQPKNPFIQDTLAMLLLKNGDTEEALKYSKLAVQAAPNIADIQINYAKVLGANNQKALAKKILNNLLRNTSDYEKRKIVSKELDKL